MTKGKVYLSKRGQREQMGPQEYLRNTAFSIGEYGTLRIGLFLFFVYVFPIHLKELLPKF